MMMQMTIPVEAGNEAARSGAFGAALPKIAESLKAEAAYSFAGPSGQCGGLIAFDMKDTSQIPGIAQPVFPGVQSNLTFYR